MTNILHFSPAVPRRSIRLEDRLRRPSRISFEATHVASDSYATSKVDWTRNPSKSSRILLPLNRSSRTSAICIANIELKVYTYCTFLSRPSFPSTSSSRIHIGSGILSSHFPNSPKTSEDFPSTLVGLMTHSTNLSPNVFADGETFRL